MSRLELKLDIWWRNDSLEEVNIADQVSCSRSLAFDWFHLSAGTLLRQIAAFWEWWWDTRTGVALRGNRWRVATQVIEIVVRTKVSNHQRQPWSDCPSSSGTTPRCHINNAVCRPNPFSPVTTNSTCKKPRPGPACSACYPRVSDWRLKHGSHLGDTLLKNTIHPSG